MEKLRSRVYVLSTAEEYKTKSIKYLNMHRWNIHNKPRKNLNEIIGSILMLCCFKSRMGPWPVQKHKMQDLIRIWNTTALHPEKLQHIQLLQKQSLSNRRGLRRSKAQRHRLVKVSPRTTWCLIVRPAARGWLTGMIGMQQGQCRPLKNLSLKAFIIQNVRTRQRKRHRTTTRWHISCYEKR